MRDDNGKPFIDRLYNVILGSELCNRLFSIIRLMNLVHTFKKKVGFFTSFFGDNEQNR